MNATAILGFVQLGLQLAPSVVGAVETLFHKQPPTATPAEKQANSASKAQAALNMAVAGLTAALNIDPSALGDNEKELILAIHNDVVRYFNTRGWPVT